LQTIGAIGALQRHSTSQQGIKPEHPPLGGVMYETQERQTA
jgi:hypothetical protein